MEIKISNSNSKLGKIPNISLIPVKDCGNCESCRSDCYALKAWKQYPNVRKAWKINSKAFRSDCFDAIEPIIEFCLKKKPRFFRIHVAGDFLDQDHIESWVKAAILCPETKFLAFTKMHHLNYADLPENMTVIMSQWPGMPVFGENGGRAWVQDGTETRIPEDAIECPGKCDDCGMCWNLPSIGKDIFFMAH
ncbi:MAG: hypothetical protein JRI72_17775 [Deltaproteobacteria bacterium]|nr:hypothetical protein [Deltaproteobacteria bacterium]